MPFMIVIVGAIIAIAAFNNAHEDLGRALKQDIPGFFKWAVAIGAILAIGFIPGMKVPSRWLIALVALIVVLTQYQNIYAGFTQFASGSGTPSGAGAPDPTAAYVAAAGQGGTPTQAQIAGDPAGSGTGAPTATQVASTVAAFNPLNPNSYVGLAAGFGGLG
jgi:hypothetical protein